MGARLFIAVMLLGVSGPCFAVESPEIRIVIADGMGRDVPSAAQNAAQNALMEVVGSFMDSTRLLQKRTEIRDGVRSQTTNLSTNVKEYSQGAVESFEVLDVQTGEGGLTQVTARVAVRVEDFRAYILSLAEGEVAVEGESLFAQAATATKQKTNKAALLNDNVLQPLINGTVARFEVSPPKPITQIENLGYELDSWSSQFGKENVFIFNVLMSLNPDFQANMTRTLAAIAEPRQVRHTVGELYSPGEYELQEQMYRGAEDPKTDSFYMLVNEGGRVDDRHTLVTSTSYEATGVRQTLLAQYPKLQSFYTYDGLKPQKLQISLLDKDDQVLQKELMSPLDLEGNGLWLRNVRAFAEATDSPPDNSSKVKYSADRVPWQLLSGPGTNRDPYLVLYTQRKFAIVMVINQSALAQTRKVRLTLVN